MGSSGFYRGGVGLFLTGIVWYSARGIDRFMQGIVPNALEVWICDGLIIGVLWWWLWWVSALVASLVGVTFVGFIFVEFFTFVYLGVAWFA